MPSYWDDDLAILSAENVNLSVETAGLGSRFAAALADITIQGLLTALVLLGVAGFSSYVYALEHLPKWALNWLLALGILLAFLLWFGYYFLFEWLWDGQTPGKRRFGLRVMMADGMPLTLWPALIRNVLRIVDMLPVAYGFGATIALTNPLYQRAGDLAAGTIVARERRNREAARPLSIQEAVEKYLESLTVPKVKPYRSEQYTEPDTELEIRARRVLDPEAAALAAVLSLEDYEMVRDYLERKEHLPKEAKSRLATSLVARFRSQLNAPQPPGEDEWLEQIAGILSRAYGH